VKYCQNFFKFISIIDWSKYRIAMSGLDLRPKRQDQQSGQGVDAREPLIKHISDKHDGSKSRLVNLAFSYEGKSLSI